ncbi:MAG TPA: LuxR C-terminal-related transcriptional regulator [Rhodocyclaceae bacterium]|jgi:DNA-binding CsgD family transcriptional regulator/hemerythrin
MKQDTGHAEIDQQHSILEALIAEFDSICPPKDLKSGIRCHVCKPVTRQKCIKRLSDITTHFLTFIQGHFNYEEKLMELLPANEPCRTHISEHKKGHHEVILFIQRSASLIGSEDSHVIASQLKNTMDLWLREHNAKLDTALVAQLSRLDTNEIEMDSALVSILDQYVFPNRPNRSLLTRKSVPRPQTDHNAQNHLGSLTARQREVCKLVASGLSNKEIALQLDTTVNTIKTHRAELYKRLRVTSLFELLNKLDQIAAIE